MTELLFTADGLLSERAIGIEPRILSRVVEGPGGAPTRLLVGEREYEVVPLAKNGLGFELRDGRGAHCGGFQPFRLRRGGHVRVREFVVSLHGRPWSHEGWAFSLPDGQSVAASVTATERLAPHGEGNAAGAAASAPTDPGSFVVVLEAAGSLQLQALAEVLVLGSWLIARWHSTPAADHVLASAANGTDLAGGSSTPAHAGIGAPAAN